MIIDKLENAYLYCGLNKNIAKAFEFLTNTDLSKLENGRYEIEGNKIFAIVQDYETKSRETALWEAHHNYTDVQYIVTGRELMGYTSLNNLKPKVEYDKTKDIEFLEGNGNFFEVKEGYFVVFMPHDAHMPSISVNQAEFVKKIVVKVEL